MLNREGWLTELAKCVEPVFAKFYISKKKYRIVCGWPCRGATGVKRRVVGECHSVESSKGGIREIFISPLLDKPLDVAGTVCHELAHVAAGHKAGHKSGFVKVCRFVGLIKGRPREVMPGNELNETLNKLIEKLGPYPHIGMQLTVKEVKPSKDITLECSSCGCKLRITLKWIEEAGVPYCGCGTKMGPRIA